MMSLGLANTMEHSLTVLERLKLGLGISTRPERAMPKTQRRAAPQGGGVDQGSNPYAEIGLAALVPDPAGDRPPDSLSCSPDDHARP